MDVGGLPAAARTGSGGTQKIHPRDPKRTLRALEVTLSTDAHFSAQQRRGGEPSHLTLSTLGPYRERAELYDRINRRDDQMITAGLVEGK